MSHTLRKLIKSFHYAHCEKLIQKKVSIVNASSISHDLSRFASIIAPNDELELADPDFDLLLGTIAKFGVADVTFSAPENFAATPIDPSRALRDLGFVPDSNDLKIEDDPNYCLNQLFEGVTAGCNYLKLFMKTTAPEIIDVPFFEKIQRVKDHSRIPFPIELSVTDACITNSDNAWFKKHNYTLLYVLNTY